MDALTINRMSIQDKISAMEALWDSLRHQEQELDSPDWHGSILSERFAAFERGETQLETLDEAKRKICEQIG
jgi:hypothetical protein